MLRRLGILCLILFLCGCETVYNPATGRNELILIDDATEAAIGRNVSAQITQKDRVLTGTSEQERVERIGRRLAAASDRQNINYEFYALDTKGLNAVSLPGGIIFVYKGLLDKLNDEELAFVLGHEVGHVAAKHAIKQLQANLGFSLLLTVALVAGGGKEGSRVTDIAKASDQIFNLISLGYSREDESFADRLGVKYSYQAGFNPYAGISALTKLGEDEGNGIQIPEYMRTHPYAKDRIKALEVLIPEITQRTN